SGWSSSSADRNFSHGGVAPRSSTLLNRGESHRRQRNTGLHSNKNLTVGGAPQPEKRLLCRPRKASTRAPNSRVLRSTDEGHEAKSAHLQLSILPPPSPDDR